VHVFKLKYSISQSIVEAHVSEENQKKIKVLSSKLLCTTLSSVFFSFFSSFFLSLFISIKYVIKVLLSILHKFF